MSLGVIFPPDRPPEELREVALQAERSGLAELWLWEDCFAESGIATATAVLAWTERLRVGIGLLPVPLRNVVLTAMELATIARLFPGRLRPGIGHGVLDWMGQVGARAQSPMTLLEEYATALRELLHGARVDLAGRYVRLEDVALAWPPEVVPPLLIGAVGPRTLELAGSAGDGVILTGDTSVEQLDAALPRIRSGREAAGRTAAADVVVFHAVDAVHGVPDPAELAATVGRYAAAGATTVALHAVGEGARPLAEFAGFVGTEVTPRVC